MRAGRLARQERLPPPGFVMPSKRPKSAKHTAGHHQGKRQVTVTIPIDLERDTRWCALELAYGLQRDARRRWCMIRSRRAWRVVFRVLRALISAAIGAAADRHLHL